MSVAAPEDPRPVWRPGETLPPLTTDPDVVVTVTVAALDGSWEETLTTHTTRHDVAMHVPPAEHVPTRYDADHVTPWHYRQAPAVITIGGIATYTLRVTPPSEELNVSAPIPEGPRPISATDRRALDALTTACEVARGPVAATALGPAFPDASQRVLTGMLRRLVDAGHVDRIRVPPVALYTPMKAP